MASVSYHQRERRLILDGVCWPDDDLGIAEAIRTNASPEGTLTVDLTRMLYLPSGVSEAIARACREAELRGCRVRVWTSAVPTAV